jgi:hypothetical protein
VGILAQPDSRTTVSILTTFQTHMRIVSVLAEAWPDDVDRRFSIRDWLKQEPKRAPLILQHDPGYPELSRIWISGMLSRRWEARGHGEPRAESMAVPGRVSATAGHR